MTTRTLPSVARIWRLVPSLAWAGLLAGVIHMSLANARATPQAGPDLVPFIEWSPRNPAVGTNLVITYGVINTGDAPAVPTDVMEVRLYVGLAQTPTLATLALHSGADAIALGAGQRRTMAVLSDVVAISTTQAVPVWVWADTTNDVAEGGEGNNLVRTLIDVSPGPDSFEDDNGCLKAQPIPMNTPQARTLWPVGDEDWVAFVADSNRKYAISAQANEADANLLIQVLLGCDAPTSAASPSVAWITGTHVVWDALVNGPAYVRVSHLLAGQGSSTGYTLTVTPSDPCFSEPNNTCHTASPLFVSGNLSKQGNFCEASDKDWYFFDAKAGKSYDIDVSSSAPGAKPKISGLEPFDCGDAPLFGDGSHQTYHAYLDGPVHVLIENELADASGGLGSSDYLISVTVAGCAIDVYEPNDVITAAKRVGVNQSNRANGCPTHDDDWFAFTAGANIPYFVETLPTVLSESPGEGDTQISVYDQNGGTVLASDDDSGPGLGARAVVSVTTPHTLYIKVTQTDPLQAGPATEYLLSVRDTPCAPDPNEPNNSIVSATVLISGTASANTLCPDQDEDHFVMTVPPGTYSLVTSDLGVAADTVLSLYDAAGTRWTRDSDDYSPKSLASRIVFSTTTTQTLRAIVRPRSAGSISSGVQYTLILRADSPLALTEVNPDNVILNPPVIESGIQTLIVTNLAQVQAQFGAKQAEDLMTKLTALKNDANVRGEVIDLNLNDTVRAAYAEWATHPISSALASAVARTIQNLILSDMAQRTSIAYLVIVGDDRIVPFQRVRDASIRYPESTYAYTLASTTVGQAQRDNFFLTDDCYSAAPLTQRAVQNWCVPLLATGRLVETPDEIISFIDRFLARSQITPTASNIALVGGYDFVEDAAEDACLKLERKFGHAAVSRAAVNCGLIGNTTLLADYQRWMLSANPPFPLHGFYGHGTHFAMGVNMNKQVVTASDVANAFSAPTLTWTPACHVGLNVPDALDFPQAYARRGVNLIANTGYGWGTSGGMAYSESMAQYLVSALVSADEVRIGQALRRAKWKYVSQQRGGDAVHPKVAMQMTLYGLPMVLLNSAGSRLSPEQAQPDEDVFPSMSASNTTPVTFGCGAPTETSGETSCGVVKSIAHLSFKSGLLPSSILSRTDLDGTSFALDGQVSLELGKTVQPRFYYALTSPTANASVRGAWIVSATYERVKDVTGTVTSVTNEYGREQVAASSDAWDNSDLATVRALPGQDTLIAFMGQGNPGLHEIRLTRAMSLEVYYSVIEDTGAPRLVSVEIHRTGERYVVKAKLADANAISRVGVLFTNGFGEWRTQDLQFDEELHGWMGTVRATGGVSFAVQALDSAGNVGRFTNKGRYFHAIMQPTASVMYLPLLAR